MNERSAFEKCALERGKLDIGLDRCAGGGGGRHGGRDLDGLAGGDGIAELGDKGDVPDVRVVRDAEGDGGGIGVGGAGSGGEGWVAPEAEVREAPATTS